LFPEGGGFERFTSTFVSSSAPGYAVAGGTYLDIHKNDQAYVINQKRGIWDSHITKVLTDFTRSAITSISSSSPGFAVASGIYQDKNGDFNTFLLNQKSGVWDSHVQNIAFQDISSNHSGTIFSVSSSAPGYAVGGGYYLDASNHLQMFRINEVNGVLQPPHKIVNSSAARLLNTYSTTSVSSVVKK